MNYGIIRKLVGKIMLLVAGLMTLPLFVCLIYLENWLNFIAFLVPITLLAGFGLLFSLIKTKSEHMQAREGFVIVGISWLLMSLFGALPLFISGVCPNFVDAFFEISSGFSTTGASILTDVEALYNGYRSILLWRSLSHWIGGMGILVFILAIIPESQEGSAVHILRAESPGPQVGKLVSKMKASSRILYIIYISITLLEMIMLLFSKDMNLFDSILTSLATAGTGGFGIRNDSIASFSPYCQYVIATFMYIFGINFTLYYFIIIGNFKDIFKNEELRWYLLFILLSVITITININGLYSSTSEAFRYSFFQVATVMSTTGFSTVDYSLWPAFSQGVIIILMFIGACAGSTAGGMKMSRLVILIKSSLKSIRKMINPRKVQTVRVDGKPLTDEITSSVQSFFVVYLLLFVVCAVLVSIFDDYDVLTNITASLACISNIGPGLGSICGPAGNYASFSNASKIVLSIEMIAGRLELFPILIMLSPRTWFKRI